VQFCGRLKLSTAAAGSTALRLHPAAAATPARTNGIDVIRILSADHHPLVRSGIAALIAMEPDMQSVGEASTCKQAVQWHR
jgi:hypothetical protein